VDCIFVRENWRLSRQNLFYEGRALGEVDAGFRKEVPAVSWLRSKARTKNFRVDGRKLKLEEGKNSAARSPLDGRGTTALEAGGKREK